MSCLGREIEDHERLALAREGRLEEVGEFPREIADMFLSVEGKQQSRRRMKRTHEFRYGTWLP